MCSKLDELWAQIVEVHNEAKTLFLLGEELDREQFRDFIQPINEHRHSLEHIVRAQANALGLDGDGVNEEYQRDSLQKALGHEYRAFFDCADWLSIILREDIFGMLAPYGNDCIKDVLPNYYSKVRTRITEISESIAQKRGDKNVSKNSQILADVREYKAIINELREIDKRIMHAQDALEDHRRKAGRTQKTLWVLGIVGALIVAGITGSVSFLAGRLTGTSSATSPQPSAQETSPATSGK